MQKFLEYTDVENARRENCINSNFSWITNITKLVFLPITSFLSFPLLNLL